MFIIDRFEGDFAVVETDNGLINIPLSDLPEGAKEGDVLRKDNDTMRFDIDVEDTAARKKRIEGKMNRLFKN